MCCEKGSGIDWESRQRGLN